jgi:hypothetical protein
VQAEPAGQRGPSSATGDSPRWPLPSLKWLLAHTDSSSFISRKDGDEPDASQQQLWGSGGRVGLLVVDAMRCGC